MSYNSNRPNQSRPQQENDAVFTRAFRSGQSKSGKARLDTAYIGEDQVALLQELLTKAIAEGGAEGVSITFMHMTSQAGKDYTKVSIRGLTPRQEQRAPQQPTAAPRASGYQPKRPYNPQSRG